MSRCLALCFLVSPLVNADEKVRLPRLELAESKAVSVGYFHIVRIPSDGATLVHTLRAFVEKDRISLEFSATQPRVDRSTWPGRSWGALVSVDADSLVFHSPSIMKPKRYLVPHVQQKRHRELTRTSGYTIPESAFAIRDSSLNRRVLWRVENQDSEAARARLSVVSSGERVLRATETLRQAGSSRRQTAYRHNDIGHTVGLETDLEPYWLDMSRQGYGDVQLPWFSPTRKVRVSIGKINGGSIAVPSTVLVSEPWSPRVRLPRRQSYVFDFKAMDAGKAAEHGQRFQDNRYIYERRMAYYKACQEITAAGAESRSEVARSKEKQWVGRPDDSGQLLTQKLDAVGLWRCAGDVEASGERYSHYLSAVQDVLPDGLAIPLGLDLLQAFSKGDCTMNCRPG